MRKSSLKYVFVAGLTLVTSLAFAASGQASGNLQPATVSGAPVGALDGSGIPLKIRIGGTNGIPVDAPAIALNVTVVNGTAPASGGYVTVYPCGKLPDASNINFVTGQTIPNSVITPMSEFGDVCFYVYGVANLIVDVSGYFPSTSGFESLSSPARIFNSRGGNRFGTTSTGGTSVKRVKIAGANSELPSTGIGAVAVNLTAVEGFDKDGFGFVTAYPCATTSLSELPDASNVNFSGGETTANSALVPVSSDGYVCFYVYGNTDLLVDASGYFPTGSGYTALSSPKRVVDTRGGNRFGTTSTGAVAVKRVKFAGATTFNGGVTGIPTTGIGAVSLNVTAAEGFDKDTYGFVTAYPCSSTSSAIPNVSNLNFAGGETIPNSVIIPLTNDGYACFYVYGNTDLLVDVGGTTSSIGFTALASGPVRLRDTREDKALGPNSLTFDFTGISVVGVASNKLAPQSVQVSEGKRNAQVVTFASNLVGFSVSGEVQALIESGNASVSRLLKAPDDSVYGLLNEAVDLIGDGASTCLLVRMDLTTGIPTCVNDQIVQVFWDRTDFVYNEPIQFDDEGNVYYSAIIKTSVSDVSGTMTLNKWNPGTGETTVILDPSDFILAPISNGLPFGVYNFLVRGDGSIFVTGNASRCDNGVIAGNPPIPIVAPDSCYAHNWYTYYMEPPYSSIVSLGDGNPSAFYKVFPNGKTYTGLDGGGRNGVFEWDDSINDVTAYAKDSQVETPRPTNCVGNEQDGGVCQQPGVPGAIYVTTNNVFHVNYQNQIVKVGVLYPKTDPKYRLTFSSAVKGQLDPGGVWKVGQYIAVSGTNTSTQKVLTLINTTTSTLTEQIVVGPGSNHSVELSFTDIVYSPENNSLVFSATKVSDGAKVTGTYGISNDSLQYQLVGSTGAVNELEPLD
jgi:hypothetical protein